LATVLIADDDIQLRDRLATYLTRCGHRVLVASDGNEAIRLVGEGGVHVVVTDINMPGLDGIEVILALADADSNVPVIAMSGGGLFGKEMLLDSAGALGAVATLEKPFEPEQVRRAIDDALSASDR
jgi:DNA-binding NtrC family response regulator